MMSVFGIYDSMADELVSVFLSQNADTAARSVTDGLRQHPDMPPHESFYLVEVVSAQNLEVPDLISSKPLIGLFRSVFVKDDTYVA